MKRWINLLLGCSLLLALAACGGGGGGSAKEAPDLNRYYEDFMAALGEDGPAMMAVEEDMLPQLYPGLEAYGRKQTVVETAMISTAAYEFALVELEDPSKAQEAADIFRSRIDYQIETGAFYPMTLESWEKAEVITHGSVVALICAGDRQSQAVEAFNKLFE